jgi:hypothetical protein
MGPGAEVGVNAVARYFASHYPPRGTPLFRAGEDERAAIVRGWLRGARVLDVGTGDGAFLARVLDDAPAELWLVDLVPPPPNAIAANARVVVGDLHDVALPDVDVALALGVTDYCRDWSRTLATLVACTRRLIVDFPRAFTPRAALRRVWLGAHGVALHTATRAGVARAIHGLGCAEVVATRHSWLVRIDRCTTS